MQIAISQETQKLIETRLNAGGYGSVDEILQAALAALEDQRESLLDPETLAAIDRSEEQMERGEVQNWVDVREKVRGMFHGK